MKKQMAKRIAVTMLSGALAFSTVMPVAAATTYNPNLYEFVDEKSDKEVLWDGTDKTLEDQKAKLYSSFSKLGDTRTYVVTASGTEGKSNKNGWTFALADKNDVVTAGTDGTVYDPGQPVKIDGATDGKGSTKNDDNTQKLYTDVNPTADTTGEAAIDTVTDIGLPSGQDVAYKWEIEEAGAHGFDVDTTAFKTYTKDATNTLKLTAKKFGTYKYIIKVTAVEASNPSKAIEIKKDGKKVDAVGYVGAFVSLPLSDTALQALIGDVTVSSTSEDDLNTEIGKAVDAKLASEDLKTSLNKPVKLQTKINALDSYDVVIDKNAFEDGKLTDDAKKNGFNVTLNLRDTLTNTAYTTLKIKVKYNNTSKATVTFSDVHEYNYFYNAVQWAAGKKLVEGYDDGTFKPQKDVTRGQVALILWREAGKPTTNKAVPFTDLPEDADMAAAIKWAYNTGITNGATDDLFKPYKAISREDLVTMLWRANEDSQISVKDTDALVDTPSFEDVNNDKLYSTTAIQWAAKKGIVDGVDATHFAPKQNAKRAELVKILYNAFN